MISLHANSNNKQYVFDKNVSIKTDKLDNKTSLKLSHVNV